MRISAESPRCSTCLNHHAQRVVTQGYSKRLFHFSYQNGWAKHSLCIGRYKIKANGSHAHTLFETLKFFKSFQYGKTRSPKVSPTSTNARRPNKLLTKERQSQRRINTTILSLASSRAGTNNYIIKSTMKYKIKTIWKSKSTRLLIPQLNTHSLPSIHTTLGRESLVN